jgi:hypothetical protein
MTHRLWQSKWNDLLGKMPDRKIAQKVGLSTSLVRLIRHKAGIPSHCRRSMADVADEALSVGSVADCARRLGCSARLVANERFMRGITVERKKRTNPERDAIVIAVIREYGGRRGAGAELARRLGSTRQWGSHLISEMLAKNPKLKRAV